MSYLEHPPAATLMPWLACIWERCAQDVSPVRVLPGGCIDRCQWRSGRRAGSGAAGAREERRAARSSRAGGRVAYEAGYADQAHFANDCHALAGLPPSLVITAE